MTIMELIQKLSTLEEKYGNIEVKYFDTLSVYFYFDIDETSEISELCYNQETNTVNIY